MPHPCPVRPYECFNSTCPKYGCLLQRCEERERRQAQEKAQEELNKPEVIALRESESYYEQLHRQAVRADKVAYKESIPITRANAVLTVFEPEEFDVLKLLSKRDQQRFERWYRNRGVQ